MKSINELCLGVSRATQAIREQINHDTKCSKLRVRRLGHKQMRKL